MLGGMGVLTKIDGLMLARYCTLYARWQAAEEAVSAGDIEQEVRAERLADRLLRIEREFGLSPSARARLATNPAKVENTGKDRFFELRIAD